VPPESLEAIKVSIREHFESILAERDRQYDLRFKASDTAVAAALAAQEKATATALATQEKAVLSALAAADRAVNKAEVASEKRFDAVNEFRSTLADQQRTLIPRSEVEVIIRSMESKINLLSDIVTRMTGEKAGQSQGWGWAAAVVMLVVAILAIAFRFIP